MNNAGDSTLRWPRSLWRSSQSSDVETWSAPGSMLVVDSHLGIGGKSQGSRMKRLKRSQDHMAEPRRAEEDLHHTGGWWAAGRIQPRGYVDCGRRTGAEQTKCGAAGTPGSCIKVGWQCGRQWRTQPPCAGPHCTLPHRPLWHRVLTKLNTMKNPIKDSNMPPNKGKLIFMMFPHCSRKDDFFSL